jgi:hypothetical protein
MSCNVIFKKLWKTSCQNNHKVFLATVEGPTEYYRIVETKKMELPSYNYVLCSEEAEEYVFHLFIGYQFAISCWETLQLQPMSSSDPFQIIE